MSWQWGDQCPNNLRITWATEVNLAEQCCKITKGNRCQNEFGVKQGNLVAVSFQTGLQLINSSFDKHSHCSYGNWETDYVRVRPKTCDCFLVERPRNSFSFYKCYHQTVDFSLGSLNLRSWKTVKRAQSAKSPFSLRICCAGQRGPQSVRCFNDLGVRPKDRISRLSTRYC